MDFCQWQPSEALLSALLDMLVDGDFDLKMNSVIKVTCVYFFLFVWGGESSGFNPRSHPLRKRGHTALMSPKGLN